MAECFIVRDNNTIIAQNGEDVNYLAGRIKEADILIVSEILTNGEAV